VRVCDIYSRVCYKFEDDKSILQGSFL